jgi:3-dehydroquinate synthase
MKIINAQTTLRKYHIYIGRDIMDFAPGLINRHFPGAEKILFITNDVVQSIYDAKIENFLKSCTKSVKKIIIKDGEEQKNLENTKYIYENMLDFNMHRDDVVIAFGGGVIGDLAGFAASTFHRGVKLLQIPTTIISQVDSSIGGKVVVNFKSVKNVVGCFYQPHAILMDTLFLETLEEKDTINGLAEIVKYGIIFDKKILKLLNRLALEKIRPGKINELISLSHFEDIIYTCAKIKTSVVKKDEFDSSYRNLLNFGHTAGHAIEKFSGFKGLNHGQAVAIGMVIALDISISLGLLKGSFKQEIIGLYKQLKLPYSLDIDKNSRSKNLIPGLEEQAGISAGSREKLSGHHEIKIEIQNKKPDTDLEKAFDPAVKDIEKLKARLADDIFDAMKFDKKFSASANKFILLKGINRPVFYHNIEAKVIKEAIIKNISIRF